MDKAKKQDLIDEAVKSFDESYGYEREQNPSLPKKLKQAKIQEIIITHYLKEQYSEKKNQEEKISEQFELTVKLKGGRSSEYELKGFGHSDEHNAFCYFPESDKPEKLRIFAKYFCENLFFNVNSEHGVGIDDWNKLK